MPDKPKSTSIIFSEREYEIIELLIERHYIRNKGDAVRYCLHWWYAHQDNNELEGRDND
jgi:hypothetical protein